jgi:hypothetical protein
VVGVDILPEAEQAVKRDRPQVYDDFFVLDFCNMGQQHEEKLKSYNFNTLVTVAALGFGDIPAKAFINAFNLIEENGNIAFNIKEAFLSEKDSTGYCNTIKDMCENHMDIISSKKYTHRLSISGEKLEYVAMVGKKKKDFDLSECELLKG